jgi:hypothetical protein
VNKFNWQRLQRFLAERLAGLISTGQILPFSLSAPTTVSLSSTYCRGNPELGRWKAVKSIGQPLEAVMVLCPDLVHDIDQSGIAGAEKMGSQLLAECSVAPPGTRLK